MPVHDDLDDRSDIDSDILNILLQSDSEEIYCYISIINNALLQNRKKLNKDDINYVYYEAHHILPKSLFKKYKNYKPNIVLLTPKEHFECHKLLTKIYPTPEMTFAYMIMSSRNKIPSEEYAKLKQNFSLAIKEKLTGVHKSEEHKKHISEGRIGLSYGSLTKEHKQKISDALLGRKPSELNRKVCSDRCKQRTGSKNTQSKRVKCVEDNLIFDTVHECEKYYNVPHLYRYCSTGKAPLKLNKHFEYI